MKKDLNKNIGRITYPKDPKMTSRPDQGVKEVETKNQINTAVGAIAERHPPEDRWASKIVHSEAVDNAAHQPYRAGFTTNSEKRDLPQVGVSHPGNDSVKEHEGAHLLISNIKDKYGHKEADDFVNHLVSHIHPSVRSHIEARLDKIPHYNKQKNSNNENLRLSYKQELLTSLRDHVLNSSGSSRKSLQDSKGNVLPEHIDLDNKIKSSWKKVKEAAVSYGTKNFVKKNEDVYVGSDLLEFAGIGSILYSSDNLKKQAFTHQDQETLIDTKTHIAALQSLPKELMDIIINVLAPMKADEIKEIPILEHNVKVRKHGPDQFSGWVESGGSITHKFEKVSSPQLMIQLQSQLELYGKENLMPLPQQKNQLIETGEKLSAHLDIPDAQAKIKDKLEALQGKIIKETIPMKDVVANLDTPEDKCEACSMPAADCSCYAHLSKPTVEIDLKTQKIKIMFKSDEWNQEDRENFREDLKRRATVLIAKHSELRGKKNGSK